MTLLTTNYPEQIECPDCGAIMFLVEYDDESGLYFCPSCEEETYYTIERLREEGHIP